MQAPSFKVDSKDLKAKAWKIYVAELGEEGIELFDDAQAAKLAQRAFKLAEIFLYHETAVVDKLAATKAARKSQRDTDDGSSSDTSEKSDSDDDKPEEPTNGETAPGQTPDESDSPGDASDSGDEDRDDS